MKIVWLSSYPKSGNTLVRMLLYSYLFSEPKESIQIDEKIPDLHKLLSRGLALKANIDSNLIIKSHFSFSDEHPYHKNTQGFIYVVRNPRDVLLSNARYLGVSSEELRDFAINFIDQVGVSKWKRMNMGNWSEHFSSWFQATSSYPSCFIKYEDLKINPKNSFKKIIEFLGIELDDGKLEVAVKASSLENARKMEESDKKKGDKSLFDNLPKGLPFVGEGRINQSLSFLGSDVEEMYKRRFGKFINVFGYE
ncbi:MAG: sulfotransferase domain-containing protein [Candidatus Caenarcaniphilales bacterium]|nr:sulfotransferase domain-containing protein [Candidatus Caenarcaniphilales bacterium]